MWQFPFGKCSAFYMQFVWCLWSLLLFIIVVMYFVLFYVSSGSSIAINNVYVLVKIYWRQKSFIQEYNLFLFKAWVKRLCDYKTYSRFMIKTGRVKSLRWLKWRNMFQHYDIFFSRFHKKKRRAILHSLPSVRPSTVTNKLNKLTKIN